MQQGLIGVIVPVYKVEKYIAECIESILAQTYTNFRLILVDDGTPDNAGKICDEYAKKDKRITVIHQENAGVTRARARGVEEAIDCEFIAFVDSDDTITIEYLEVLHYAMNDNVDIVINESCLHTNYISIEELLHLCISLTPNYCWAPWSKLFRKRLFTPQIFNIPKEIVVGEDAIMLVRLIFNSDKKWITVINKRIYNYNYMGKGVSHTHNTSPTYENLFNKTLIKSIPVKQLSLYMADTIKNRLIQFNLFWGYKIFVERMKTEEFYKDLENDMRKYNYKMSATDMAIFKYENPFIRFIAINTKKVQKIVLNKMRLIRNQDKL